MKMTRKYDGNTNKTDVFLLRVISAEIQNVKYQSLKLCAKSLKRNLSNQRFELTSASDVCVVFVGLVAPSENLHPFEGRFRRPGHILKEKEVAG